MQAEYLTTVRLTTGGLCAVNGFDMLIYQGIASYEIWHDKKIDEKTAKEIRDALAVYYKEKILGDANG